jgi:sigma-E factor negative regulatory protein RseC
MLCESATVVGIDGQELKLRSERSAACAGCSVKGGCGQYLLARPSDDLNLPSSTLISGSGAGGNPVGSKVQIELASGQLLQLAVIFYVLPLGTLLAATLLAWLFGGSEGQQAAAAFVGLAAGVLATRRLLSSDAVRQRVSPRLRPLAAVASNQYEEQENGL